MIQQIHVSVNAAVQRVLVFNGIAFMVLPLLRIRNITTKLPSELTGAGSSPTKTRSQSWPWTVDSLTGRRRPESLSQGPKAV